MPRDNREIFNSVTLEHTPTDKEGKRLMLAPGKEAPIARKVFNPGDEDELEDWMSKEEMEYLKEQNAIGGQWHPKGAGPPTPEKARKMAAEKQAALDAEREEAEAAAAKAAKSAAHGKGEK